MEDAIRLWKQSHPEDDVQVEWRAFQLNPDLPPEGEDRELHMGRKFGSMDRIQPMVQRVADIAEAEGLPFTKDQKGRQPNTFLLHALIRKAEEKGKSFELAEIFFRNFFAENKDLSDADAIRESLKEAGLDPEDLERVKNDRELLDEIRETEYQGRKLGVSGVPFFVFNEKYAVSGAQESALFLQVFDQLKNENSTV